MKTLKQLTKEKRELQKELRELRRTHDLIGGEGNAIEYLWKKLTEVEEAIANCTTSVVAPNSKG